MARTYCCSEIGNKNKPCKVACYYLVRFPPHTFTLNCRRYEDLAGFISNTEPAV